MPVQTFHQPLGGHVATAVPRILILCRQRGRSLDPIRRNRASQDLATPLAREQATHPEIHWLVLNTPGSWTATNTAGS